MIRFIKKHWFIIFLSFIAMLFVISKFLINNQPVEISTPTPTTTNIASYKSLVPGKSTLDQVNELLGLPVKEDKENGVKIAEYESTNQYRNHVVELDDDKVSLIKEIINTPDNKNADSVRSVYGIAPYILYDQYPAATFQLYVYPQNGIAYLGHEDGTLLEIWYFEPTTIDEFLTKWGQGYGKVKPEGPTDGH